MNKIIKVSLSIFRWSRNGTLIKIINHERILAIIFLIILCIFLVLNNMQKPRIFILHSYHQGYSWVDDQNEGMHRIFKDKLSYIFKEYYLDTKRKPYPDYMKRVGREARELIESWRPNIVIACDDDAQEFVGRYFVNDPKIKILFTGVQADYKKYGYGDANNVTGILEKLALDAVHETLIDLNAYSHQNVTLKRIFHLSDKSTYSHAVLEEIKSFSWQPFALVDSLEYETFDDWKQGIEDANKKADILLITNYRTIRRSTQDMTIVPAQEIIEWTEQNSPLPKIGTWGFYVEDGGMLAMGVSGYEQGEVAARMAVEILDKKQKIQTMPIQKNQLYLPYIREASLKEYNLQLPNIYEAFARASKNYF